MLFQSLTPRKLKARSVHGSIPASPGGPNAIRISSFSLIGSTVIRLEDVKKDKFVLQKVVLLFFDFADLCLIWIGAIYKVVQLVHAIYAVDTIL